MAPELPPRLLALLTALRLRLSSRGGAAGSRPPFSVKLLFVLFGFANATFLARRWRRKIAIVAPEVVALSAVLGHLREGNVQELVYSDGGALMVRLKKVAKGLDSTAAAAGARLLAHLVPGSEATVFQLADRAAVPSIRYQPAPRDMSGLFSYVMLFAMMFAWYKAAKSLMSKEEKFAPRRDAQRVAETTCFADVICKSKIELAEIVDYLNHPEKYKKAGAKLPRGALLVGPSGTGKTLLARAVAGEAKCAFLSASASEFVEVFVGRGAARVRDLFRQARQLAPVVLFLDELDALGSRRGTTEGRGTNEEYVQTINQLLTELDGFHGQADGIVVLAATNRREVVDPALLRPGRFDRHVTVELPDEAERLQILRLHAGKAAMAAGLLVEPPSELQRIATDAAGLSGAELANMVNEAVFLALRAGRELATLQDLRVALGRARACRPENGNAESNNFSRTFLRGWPAAPMTVMK